MQCFPVQSYYAGTGSQGRHIFAMTRPTKVQERTLTLEGYVSKLKGTVQPLEAYENIALYKADADPLKSKDLLNRLR